MTVIQADRLTPIQYMHVIAFIFYTAFVARKRLSKYYLTDIL